MQIYSDQGGECQKLLMNLGKMIKDRDAAIREWDEEEKKQPPADEVVKAAIAEDHKPRWKAEDRPFVKKLIEKSLKAAAECNERNEPSLRDIFVAQAARLEQELKQLESLYGVYKEPKPVTTGAKVKIKMNGKAIKVFGNLEPKDRKTKKKARRRKR
jgi:hypothetical protein